MREVMFQLLLIGVLAYGGYQDYKRRIIPNIVPAAIFLLGIAAFCFFPDKNTMESIIGLGIPSSVLILLYLRGVPVGGGDLKILAAMGFALGIYVLMPVLLFAAISGNIWAKYRHVKSIPLASFLVLGYALLLLIC